MVDITRPLDRLLCWCGATKLAAIHFPRWVKGQKWGHEFKSAPNATYEKIRLEKEVTDGKDR